MGFKNIVVFSFSRIGDVVLSTAVISPLRERFPESNISFIAGPNSWEILWGDIRLSELLIYDSHQKHSGVVGRLNFVKSLKAKNFDLVIDLRDTVISWVLGCQRWGASIWQRMDDKWKQLHAVDRYLSILNLHGVETKSAAPEIPLLPWERTNASEFMSRAGIRRSDLVVGIHPGGSWRYKLWPVERFAQLADLIIHRFKAKVVIFAGPGEENTQRQMAELMDYPAILVSGTNLRELSALIQQCSLYIGNDTGPMHIAAAVGTRVISLFGPTDSRRSGPYGKGHIVISEKVPCSPCHPGKKPGHCKLHVCKAMELITVERVIRVMEKILDEPKETFISC